MIFLLGIYSAALCASVVNCFSFIGPNPRSIFDRINRIYQDLQDSIRAIRVFRS
jgi:hypothetical protein